MGCGFHKTGKEVPSPIRFKLKTKELTITPGTFIKLSHDNKIKHYKEIKHIGSGSFSDVLLCEHLPTKTLRALKIVHKKSLCIYQKSTTCMLKEIQILRILDHPNIIKCFEIFEDERHYYLSTEYCSGGDLFQEISKMPVFTEAKASNIIFQLLSALNYCHEKGIIHRDLKPENILLIDKTNILTIKIADFGSSCIVSSKSRIRGCFGSSYYLAPEVFEHSYNEKCDIWSVGIMMYILLIGTPPYKGKDNDSIIKEILKCPFEISKENTYGISDMSFDLLKSLLKLNPDDRISANEAIMHPWIINNRNHKGENLKLTLKRLKNFSNHSKLKEAVHIYLASQVVSYEDIKEIRRIFQTLDKDGNGKITRQELLEEYMKVMEFTKAQKIVERIIDDIDQDNDGNIDYTEFLACCREGMKKESEENLILAFNLFDLDGNGVITVDEIRSVLENGQIADEKVWFGLLQEADSNGDGLIDLDEFIKFMRAVNM
ncbi:hypothetical protein SteCoe_30512 [Stentor coeruleus]|uniref:non-specific serine/threonine protein kinase n=1 Tax=Stentor coeruleus TaxID=5963 RepID=A0A1R2B3H4_9CILI|nr:hypothetical protein SteCoe_30512 [Stentor coeruleus]